ncbi:acetyl-CoA acetyltransferase [Rhodococcus sp. 06-235-1A]|uniref:acetyl-CoA acetyltransferase n=1 Tax=Rhodococcus sp. 06-235-1A TaxID=2022508 RepID=UPI000B9B65AC|nr:acetyl-CoA acetyltransferase [Rhodococcus sp. 06-235-1A]OZD01223.1 acetyl-CoA acetyltransferase [Rhodococcus sp. 06-235-1A]
MLISAERVPVIVGVGDLKFAGDDTTQSTIEPLELVLRAVNAAIDDAGGHGLKEKLDAVHAVRTTSWNYDDLPSLVADRLGVTLESRSTSTIGGHHPVRLLDQVGRDIAEGLTTAALVVGGEAQASVRALMKAGVDPGESGWTTAPGGPPSFSPEDLGSAEMQRAGILAPVQIYPLFENARAHGRGLTPNQALRESADMYSRFSAIAAEHPVAWSPVFRTPEDIGTVTSSNRSVSDCYPLSMNAMPFVDQAAAVLVCSLATARKSGVAEDRMVYLWGGAGAVDNPDVLARPVFDDAPALRAAVQRALSRADATSANLAFVDAYSCFPIVPELLADELGLAEGSTPTVLGGHSFFGGPLSSYSLHAVAESTRLLRKTSGVALVHANGGYLTYQHVVLLSTTAHRDGYVGDPEPVDSSGTPARVVHGYSGRATIETATVTYDRSGLPEQAFVVAATDDGARVAGRAGREFAATLHDLVSGRNESAVGRRIELVDKEGKLAVGLCT